MIATEGPTRSGLPLHLTAEVKSASFAANQFIARLPAFAGMR